MKRINKKYPKRCVNCASFCQNRGNGGRCREDDEQIENPYKMVCKEKYNPLQPKYL